jgi:hypothetical protein
VFNRAVTNVDYTIVATEYTNVFPTIITLFSSIPYANTNAGIGTNIDYYRFVVSSNAVRAQFEINGASGPMSLVARRGLPLPDLTSYSVISTNPGTADELISLLDNFGTVRLTPGDWFLGAVNISGGPVTYSIKATEYFAYATNIVIINPTVTSNNFCFSWSSVPGVPYYVQGVTNLGSTNWTTLSGTITASALQTTFCIPLPSIYQFFRVVQGTSPLVVPVVSTNTISSVSVTTNGILLKWNAPTNLQFQVQWTPTIPTASWNTFTNIITSLTGSFSFLDDGSQSGGLGGMRFYRLLQLP